MAVLLLAAAPARAQVSDPELRPTSGPFIIDATRAGDADATAVELNPGSLGLLPGGSLELVAAAGDRSGVLPRRGAGLYWGTPLFGRTGFGLALTRTAGAARFGLEAHTALRLGLALRLWRGGALGVTWAHLWGGDLTGTDTFDLGLSTRFGRYLALGVTVQDVGEPRPPAFAADIPRLWNAELMVRPLGTSRLELSAGAAHADGDQWSRLVPRGRLSVILAGGLRFFAAGDIVHRDPIFAIEGRPRNVRLSFGLALDLDHFGGAVGPYLFAPGTDESNVGFGARIHFAAARSTPIVAPRYVARVRLEEVEDDRGFLSLVRRLRALAVEPGAVAVLLKVENVHLSTARIEELRALVAQLRASGKRIFAYAPSPSTREYFLASAADAIILHPGGRVTLNGLASDVTFYKSAMERVGVHVDVVRIGAYKGAMEPFIMNEQSPEVRANRNKLYDDVFAHITEGIAAGRTRTGHRMDVADVRRLVDVGMFTPVAAQQAGLADALSDEGDLEEVIGRALGRTRISIRDPDPSPLPTGMWPTRRVAVVFVEGSIVDGPSQKLPFGLGTFAGSDTIIDALNDCRRDPSVGAVVLRVNSPGGSSFASDVMARAINRVRAAHKPVVVSMADSAASGGYYISAPGDVVFADPSTVTGSIGIYSFKPDVAKLFGLLGLNVEVYRRGEHADLFSPYRAWTPAELTMIGEQMRYLYGQFVDTVVAGRKSRGLTAARVDELGRGQVWSGSTAKELGLVDKMGGLADAIDEAVRLSRVPVGRDGVPDLVALPKAQSGILRELIGLSQAADWVSDGEGEGGSPEHGAGAADPAQNLSVAKLATPELRAALRLLAPILFAGGNSLQARMPYDLEIR